MSEFKASSITTPRHYRPTRDYDEDDLTGPNFIDHFSLREPSSTVKFRGSRVHVYEADNEQFLLEDRKSSRPVFEDDDNGKNKMHRHNITVKRMPMGSFGLLMLRTAYTLVSLLLFGIAFVLSFQIILFLFVKLAVDGKLAVDKSNDENSTDADLSIISTQLIGTILSTPIFLYGFGSLMGIATTFVSEAWSGGDLIRSVMGAPALVKEVLYFVCFILIPALTFVTTTFLRIESIWEYTCYAWLAGVSTTFCFFALSIVWCEVAACFRLITIHYDDEGFFAKLKRAVLIVLYEKYSGTKDEQYLVSGDDVPPTGGYTFSDKHTPLHVYRSLYTRITQLGCLKCMYETEDPPKRVYSIEEVRDELPFITKYNWSLEMMLCMGDKKRKIISAKGPTGLKPSQVFASAACNILGSLVIIASVVGYLYWLELGMWIYIFVAILCGVCCVLPMAVSNLETVMFFADVNKNKHITVDEEGGLKEEEAAEVEKPEVTEESNMFKLWETSRITRPKHWVCWTGLLLEFGFLFAWPLTSLFVVGNWPIGLVYLVLSLFSFTRIYIDESAVLCELGCMNAIDIEPEKARQDDKKTLVRKARLSDIVGRVSRSETVTMWMYGFTGIVLFALILYALAVASGDGLGDRRPIVLVKDFEYTPEPSLQYPSCTMSKGFKIDVDGEEQNTFLGDYAFFSAMAYETPDVTSYVLPKMFGEGIVVDEDKLVKDYREEAGTANTPVYFKLFTFPNAPTAGVMAIRGSQTMWDWMVNFQLWSSSGLVQLLKWMLPYGWIWTPILDEIVTFIGFIQTEQLEEVSYYHATVDFVNAFKEQYSSLQVTGASLGGGLAVITGAQAKTPAVAISGLGAEYSRNVLTPQVTMDDINKYVFNYIPDRDYIARVGGRPRQSQEAECTAAKSSLLGCHSMWRSVCEIQYRCGTGGRPVICRCHFMFGYPEPTPIGNTTVSFKEACEAEEQAFLEATGSSIETGWFETSEIDGL